VRLLNDPSDSPDEGCHFTGNGDHDLIGVFTSGGELTIAFAQSYLRLPADVLDSLGDFLQAEL